MNAIKNLFAKIASFFKSKEEPPMTEVATTDATTATATPVATTNTLSTDTLKSLLITLGHDVEAEWDHLIALATKSTATTVVEPVAAA